MIKIIPLIITITSSISTLLGYFLIFINNKYKDKIIISSLSLASSIMLSVSLLDLIPYSYKLLPINNNFIKAILLLIILNIGIIIINKINNIKYLTNKTNLHRLGILSMIAIILHNIPEGIITYITSSNNISLGIKLSISILLHNIPEGITIAVPIYYSTNSRKKALFYTLISALSEPLGAILSILFLEKYINNLILSIIFLLTASIMIELSLKELLKESLNYNNKKLTIIFFILGIIIILLTHNV